MHNIVKQIGGSAGTAKNVYEEWEGTPEYQARNLIEQRRRLGWSDDKIVNELRYRGLPTDGVVGLDDNTFPHQSPPTFPQGGIANAGMLFIWL